MRGDRGLDIAGDVGGGRMQWRAGSTCTLLGFSRISSYRFPGEEDITHLFKNLTLVNDVL